MDREYTVVGKKSQYTKEKKHKSIKYDGHSFNKNYVAAYGSEAKFLEASKEKGHLVGWFENDANRDDKLKEVWRLANDEKAKGVKDPDSIALGFKPLGSPKITPIKEG